MWYVEEDILKNVGSSVPIYFHMGKKYNGSQWEPKLFGYQQFWNNIMVNDVNVNDGRIFVFKTNYRL